MLFLSLLSFDFQELNRIIHIPPINNMCVIDTEALSERDVIVARRATLLAGSVRVACRSACGLRSPCALCAGPAWATGLKLPTSRPSSTPQWPHAKAAEPR